MKLRGNTPELWQDSIHGYMSKKQESKSMKVTIHNSQKMRCKIEHWEQEVPIYQVFTFLASFSFFPTMMLVSRFSPMALFFFFNFFVFFSFWFFLYFWIIFVSPRHLLLGFHHGNNFFLGLFQNFRLFSGYLDIYKELVSSDQL